MFLFILCDIFIYFIFNFFVHSCYFIFRTQKVAAHCKEQNKKKNYDNWLKNTKGIKRQKMPKKLEIFSLKYIKVLEFKNKKPKAFLNKGTRHGKNYKEGLNSKNKNIKGRGSS